MSAVSEPTPNQILTAACILAEKGYKLIRVSRRSKVPYDKDWVNLATNDLATLTEWFDGGDFNLGLACGLQPNGLNIVAIDIDPKHGGVDTWAAFVREHGKVGGPRHDTPSGGFHLPLIFPEGFRNSRNMLGPGIDTRGEGGQILLPPSCLIDHESGELIYYGASPGRSMWDLAPIEAPLALVEALSTKPVQVQRSVERHPSAQETPFDFLRRTVDPVDVMVNRYGWQVHSVRGDDTWLTRPGKNPREGHSAVVHGSGAIVVFTTTDVQHLVQRPTSDGTGIKMSLAEFCAAEEGIGLSEFSRRIRAQMPPPPGVSAERPTPATDGGTDGSEDGPPPNSWTEDVDVLAALEGRTSAPEPTILVRADGVGLFYPGSPNLIYGDSGRGKGWVCCVALAQEISLGHNVMYLDLEDTVGSINARLQILGLLADQIARHLTYRHPADPADPAAIDALISTCKEREITLVVIDSLGEAFALDGINENNDAEVGPWISRVARRIANRSGAAVVMVDHSTKSQEYRLHPSGSKRKRAAAEAAYLVEPLRDLVKGRGGALKLITAKDRHGTHQANRPAAIINFIPSGDGMRAVISPVADDQFQPETPVETFTKEVTERQLEVLGLARRLERDTKKPWTRTRLADYVGGKATTTREAINRLIEHGHCTEVGTYKNSSLHLVSEDAPATRFDP